MIGALYRGAMEHIRFQAGGNEKAQIQVANVGIVTTSEKYTIAHSRHVGVHFLALRWHHHPIPTLDDSSDDNVNHRRDDRPQRRHEQQVDTPDADRPIVP